MAEGVVLQIKEAEQYKQQGNAFFKDGNYKRALGSYHKVFCYLNGLQMPGEQSEASGYAQMVGQSSAATQVPPHAVEEVNALKSSSHLNMAACYLKTNSYAKCVDVCGKALQLERTSKAFFRRGQANLELRNLDEAKADFEEAQALEPENKAIVAELRRLKAAFAQHEAKEKKKFSKMFSKMAEDREETAAGEQEAARDTGSVAVVPTNDEAKA